MYSIFECGPGFKFFSSLRYIDFVESPNFLSLICSTEEGLHLAHAEKENDPSQSMLERT